MKDWLPAYCLSSFIVRDIEVACKMLKVAKRLGVLVEHSSTGRKVTWITDDGACISIRDTSPDHNVCAMFAEWCREAEQARGGAAT